MRFGQAHIDLAVMAAHTGRCTRSSSRYSRKTHESRNDLDYPSSRWSMMRGKKEISGFLSKKSYSVIITNSDSL